MAYNDIWLRSANVKRRWITIIVQFDKRLARTPNDWLKTAILGTLVAVS
jgi:hypothetical protein